MTDNPNNDTCNDCAFFFRFANCHTGNCQQESPRYVAGTVGGVWPVTALDDWCGKWQPTFQGKSEVKCELTNVEGIDAVTAAIASGKADETILEKIASRDGAEKEVRVLADYLLKHELMSLLDDGAQYGGAGHVAINVIEFYRERSHDLKIALRDVLARRGNSILAIMDNSDAAKDRAEKLLKKIDR